MPLNSFWKDRRPLSLVEKPATGPSSTFFDSALSSRFYRLYELIPLMMRYPTKRVIFSFTLCPAVPAPLIGGALIFADSAALFEQLAWYYWLPTYVGISLWVSFCALIFFGLPSFLLAVTYAYQELQRSPKHLFFISLSGGFVASMIAAIVLPWRVASLTFILGAFTSLLIGCLALPKGSA